MKFRIIVRIIVFVAFLFSILFCNNNINKNSHFRIGLLEYEPGDWNSDQTALSELTKFIIAHLI